MSAAVNLIVPTIKNNEVDQKFLFNLLDLIKINNITKKNNTNHLFPSISSLETVWLLMQGYISIYSYGKDKLSELIL